MRRCADGCICVQDRGVPREALARHPSNATLYREMIGCVERIPRRVVERFKASTITIRHDGDGPIRAVDVTRSQATQTQSLSSEVASAHSHTVQVQIGERGCRGFHSRRHHLRRGHIPITHRHAIDTHAMITRSFRNRIRNQRPRYIDHRRIDCPIRRPLYHRARCSSFVVRDIGNPFPKRRVVTQQPLICSVRLRD